MPTASCEASAKARALPSFGRNSKRGGSPRHESPESPARFPRTPQMLAPGVPSLLPRMPTPSPGLRLPRPSQIDRTVFPRNHRPPPRSPILKPLSREKQVTKPKPKHHERTTNHRRKTLPATKTSNKKRRPSTGRRIHEQPPSPSRTQTKA